MAKKKTTRGDAPSSLVEAEEEGGMKRRLRGTAASLSDELVQLRSDFDAYVQRTTKELEASRQEVQRLSRRLHHLEQLNKQRLLGTAGYVPMQAPASTAKSLFTFLGRPSLPSLS